MAVAELPSGSGGRDLTGGPHTRHGAVGGTSYRQDRPPGRRPFWPTQTHLLHPIESQWFDSTTGGGGGGASQNIHVFFFFVRKRHIRPECVFS